MRYFSVAIISIFICLVVGNSPAQSIDSQFFSYGGGTTVPAPVHPDQNKKRPPWTVTLVYSSHMHFITRLLDASMSISTPTVRMWYNITDEDRKRCPECNPMFNEIVGNEIWLRKESTARDMMMTIIMYYQYNTGGINFGDLYGDLSTGERNLVYDRWFSSLSSDIPIYRYLIK